MKPKYIMVDIEADGPVPPLYSMIWFGAVIVDDQLDKKFEGKLLPISKTFNPEALAISGLTREQTETFEHPAAIMKRFSDWVTDNLKTDERPVFVSDNNGFDWMFICYYLWRFTGSNVFGHSSFNLNSFYKGISRDMRASFKSLRKTTHDHNPVNDATSNAEAFVTVCQKANIKY